MRRRDLDEILARLAEGPTVAPRPEGIEPCVVLTPTTWRGRCGGAPRCGMCSLCRAEARVSIAGDAAARSEKHLGTGPRPLGWRHPEHALAALFRHLERQGFRSGFGSQLDAARLGIPLFGSSRHPEAMPELAAEGVELAEVGRAWAACFPPLPDGIDHEVTARRIVEAVVVGVPPVPEKRKPGGQRKRGEGGRTSVSTDQIALALGVGPGLVRACVSQWRRVATLALAPLGLLPVPPKGTRLRVEVLDLIEEKTRRTRKDRAR